MSLSLARREPRCARRHDQLLGALRIDSGQFHKVVHRKIGQILLGGHAFRGQHARRLVIHALEREQVAGHVFDMLLAGDGLDKKRIARTAPQLVDGIFVERLDFEHLVERHIGNLFQSAESFLYQNVGDLLVDIENPGLYRVTVDFTKISFRIVGRDRRPSRTPLNPNTKPSNACVASKAPAATPPTRWVPISMATEARSVKRSPQV